MDNKNRYSQMEQIVTIVLACSLLLFIIYLISAGSGVIWLKVLSSIFTILSAGLCLAYLYFTAEWLKQRSLWMTAASVALVVCTLFSLILNFPCPAP